MLLANSRDLRREVHCIGTSSMKSYELVRKTSIGGASKLKLHLLVNHSRLIFALLHVLTRASHIA